ncbi:NEL-type E3 ubiquitin ligase domain-containing protein [Pseudomonas trivialis]|uniref:NEL-type E3 ubiquitin ligase domain-containing protein n=1 Tax=Pseudomonas trivialis TaxID=200450 RepID=UPI0009E640BF|nr:NEL-type E3 ubiquitin ligase domain-containing protein [Pseudomonas trivialis]
MPTTVQPPHKEPVMRTPVTPSIHRKQLVKATPQWLIDTTASRREALKNADSLPTAAYWRATPEQRERLHDCCVASLSAQTALDKTMSALQDIDTFATPLLDHAMREQFDAGLFAPTWIRLRKTAKYTFINLDIGTYTFLQLELLQAALHNFEADECEKGFFSDSSGFREYRKTTPSQFSLVIFENMQVHEFLMLCRELDLGGKYQTYIKAFFHPADATREATLRQQFIASQKAAMRVAAEIALLCGDVDDAEYAMVLSVINGEIMPRLGEMTVWFGDLSLKKLRMTGCLVFVVKRDEDIDRYILYIPHDPEHALKSYRPGKIVAQFTKKFTTPDPPLTSKGNHTAYQRFFSQFVNYADRPYYFSLFTKDAPDADSLQVLKWKFPDLDPRGAPLLDSVLSVIAAGLPFSGAGPQVPDPDAYLEPSVMRFNGQEPWEDNKDPWSYLYQQSRAKSIADAASHAVPTADVDAKVRAEKLDMLLNLELFAFMFVAGFVPVLGEFMMAEMAAQLLREAVEGVLEWNEGDRQAAKAHLIDVAGNLAFIALTAGAAKGFAKLNAEPVIERLESVKLPDGQTRLWRPDLERYNSGTGPAPGVKPNALGQYTLDGKTYIRLDNVFYETTFDTALNKWRIKHVDDGNAYQPVLEHNGAGAWRHSYERPLTWDRLTLLRRLGPVTESFSDETLSAIGQVSGIDDDVLRKVHMDGLPVPAVLADTLEQFQAGQDVDELIAQIRRGTGLDSRYEYAVPLIVELPGWPAGRVLEIFDDAGLAGPSQRYGSPLSPTDTRVTFKVSRDQLRQGKLVQSVLAGLNPEETTALLGSESSWGGNAKEQVLNERLADYALSRQSSLRAGLAHSSAAPDLAPDLLQRRFPALSTRAHEQLLDGASPQELMQLQANGRVSARLDDLARIGVQQGRLSRAIGGLQRDNLAGADSDRLALHSLERLPGWPGGVRLEIRLGSHQGPLVDSIGNETLAVRRCLVKEGDSFQAQDEAGNALNSVPSHGRNLFQSMMQALPEETRRALKLPLTAQGADLQQVLAVYAREHRSTMAQLLKLRVPRSRPSLRLPSGRLGYALAGKGGAVLTTVDWATRIQRLYPNISELEVATFIEARLRNGESESQIMALLAERDHELTALQATLNRWSASDASRRRVAQDLVSCWREGFDRAQAPHALLVMRGQEALPELAADFSHVRTLNLSGRRLLAQEGASLLQPFPNVRSLQLHVRDVDLHAVVEHLPGLSKITELSLSGVSPTYSPEVVQLINRMKQLEHLALTGRMATLDVSGLSALRTLKVTGSLETWPEGVAALERLESLDLVNTQVRSVPPEMFAGHKRVWRGLKMNWSRFEPRDFMDVYEYLHDNPAHWVDEELLVQDYCGGTLRGLRPGSSAFVENALAEFNAQGVLPRQRLERVIAVRDEYRVLDEELRQWPDRELGGQSFEQQREAAGEALMECWHRGLEQRFLPAGRRGSVGGDDLTSGLLDLSGQHVGELPRLPAAGFAHVRNLALNGIGVSLEGINEWLASFARLDRLSLAQNNLFELPEAVAQLESLQQLDLSHNWLVITPSLQTRLNGLTNLASLHLQYNPVGSLDVSQLQSLLTLDLSHSALSAWPEGVLDLPALERLDMSHSAVTTIPEAALNTHDPLLLNTDLRGCRLSVAARVEARSFARRQASANPPRHLDRPLGIPREALAQGSTGGDPEYYPADILQHPDLLIALPAVEHVQLAPTVRLQRLDPALDNAQALARMAELSASGLDAPQIEARLAEWEQQHAQCVQVLNDWIDIHRLAQGDWVRALGRRRAADRLMQSWRDTLRASAPAPATQGLHLLDLAGLSLGDLPELPAYFSHVTELNLERVMLTEQGSNGFLRAFTHVRTLTLSNNGLQVLPDVIAEFRALQSLDLSDNVLSELDVTGLTRLDTLRVGRNHLSEWPVGVLRLPRLRTLDLRHNLIETLPATALEPQHRQLIEGTNLRGNILQEQACEDLQVYLSHTGNGLGHTAEELDQLIEAHRLNNAAGAVNDGAFLQEHPDIESPEVQKARWFSGIAQDSTKHQIWTDLTAEQEGSDFFFALSQLRHTKDFIEAPVELTQRVWGVLESIQENPSMRREVFAKATALLLDYTCGDGRILIFNDLETSVLGFKVLELAKQGRDGAAVLTFARQATRLEAAEAHAQINIEKRPGVDPAEVRLAYRIGLAEDLELPPQPRRMLYRELAGVTSDDLTAARNEILSSERAPAFEQRLLDIECWERYLKHKYAAEFSALGEEMALEHDALEARYPDFGPDYRVEYSVLSDRRKAQMTALGIRLSKQERHDLGM